VNGSKSPGWKRTVEVGLGVLAMCDNNSIESIPISDQEAFKFEHSESRGVTLNFFPIHKKPPDAYNVR